MLKINQVKCHITHTEEQLKQAICKKCRCKPDQLKYFKILKRSVDARKKPELFFQYTVLAEFLDEKFILSHSDPKDILKAEPESYVFKIAGNISMKPADRPVIIGAGPAGLFCAYELAQNGYKPLILERGADVDQRTKIVEEFWSGKPLNPVTNVQFGEGGAGTFSDGKLNTLVKDPNGRNRHVLETFVKFGGPEEILYDQKPHLGTDILKDIVKKMRLAIQEAGGEFRFQTQVTDFLIQNDQLYGLILNQEEELPCSIAALAIGHSARDTYQKLEERLIRMEAKAFAVGYRVIHPQEFINQSQYGHTDVPQLGAAPYKLTATSENGRGVYSFCMCPGGYVVNASSAPGETAVNGMSYSGRNGSCANSAIVVAVSPSDYPGEGPLSGIQFQKELEKKAYLAGNGSVPVEKYGLFRKELEKRGMIQESVRKRYDVIAPFQPDIRGGYQESDLTEILPPVLLRSFSEGMERFDRMIQGFASEETWLCGVESRTSSPVRIVRDESMQASVKGLYPCGEGAGYAGGITSAAMDGIKIAEMIASKFRP